MDFYKDGPLPASKIKQKIVNLPGPILVLGASGFIGANLFRALQGTNCIATAYMFSSSIVLNQMKRIIAEAEAPIQILDCLFADLQSAKAYVLKQLEFAEMAC